MSNKTTRKALVTSVVSLLVCVTMLMGTTFAWFTDTATVSVNKIQSGTLTLELTDDDGNNVEDGTLYFVDPNGNPITGEYYWEPGCTYNLQTLNIKNTGNLNLKFKVVVTGINGDAELNKVIDWTIECAGETYTEGAEIKLAPLASAAFTVKGHMQETAGNEYMGKSIDGIAITVLATQDTVESDSIDNQYDKNATYDMAGEYEALGYTIVSVDTDSELNDAVANVVGSTAIKLDKGTYHLPESNMQNMDLAFIGEGDAMFDFSTFNLNATQRTQFSTITFDGVDVKFNDNSWLNGGYTGLNTNGGKLIYKNCTIYGAQYLTDTDAEFINCTFVNVADSYSVCTYAANNVTFDNCTFNTAGKAVLLYCDAPTSTNVTFTKCVFISDDTAAADKAAVETGDDGSKASVFNITFTNCTSNGFDANNSSSPLWGNKLSSNMPTDRLNVVIDNVEVY